MKRDGLVFVVAAGIGFGAMFSLQREKSAESAQGDSGVSPITFEGAQSISSGLKGTHLGGTQPREKLIAWMGDPDDLPLAIMAAREWARTEDPDGTGIRALFESGYEDEAWIALLEWGELEPLAASKMAEEFPSVSDRAKEAYETVISEAIERLLEQGDEAAIKVANRYSRRDDGYSSAGSAFENFVGVDDWSEKRIRETLELTARIESPWLSVQYSQGLLEKLAVRDFGDAMEWADEHLLVTHRVSIRDDLLNQVLSEKPRDALRFIDSQPDGPEKQEWTRLLIRGIANASDTAPIREWLRKQGRESIEVALEGRGPPSLFQSSYAEKLGEEFAWLDSPSKEERPPLFEKWPIETPEQAKGWAATVARNQRQILPEDWTFETIDETLALLRESGDELTTVAARAITEEMARRDPSDALAWAADLPEHLQIEAADAALERWFSYEPDAARNYVDTMPNSEFRRYAVERIAGDWLDRDAEPAIKWINRMARGIDKDIGRGLVAERFRQRNPQRAFAQANAIDNPVLRDEALERIFGAWFRRDPEQARNFLSEANLAPERIGEIERVARR